MVKLSEMELKMLIKGGETNTVELKLAAPRATEMAERFCGMANAWKGIIIYQHLPNPKSLISYPTVNKRF